MALKAVRNLFDDKYNATIGFEFVTINMDVEGSVCKLQIWDTCGQEEYRSLVTNFYRNTACAIVVYAINECSYKKRTKLSSSGRLAEGFAQLCILRCKNYFDSQQGRFGGTVER